MIELYTDEEIYGMRKPWVDLLEMIWIEIGHPNFVIRTPDDFLLTVYTDGEMKASDLNGFACRKEYSKLYPHLSKDDDTIYFAKTSELKEHLINLILNRESKVAFNARSQLGKANF